MGRIVVWVMNWKRLKMLIKIISIDLFMKGIPQIENKESDEIKTFEQEKGL